MDVEINESDSPSEETPDSVIVEDHETHFGEEDNSTVVEGDTTVVVNIETPEPTPEPIVEPVHETRLSDDDVERIANVVVSKLNPVVEQNSEIVEDVDKEDQEVVEDFEAPKRKRWLYR